MNINYDKLRKVIEVYAKPWWDGEVESNGLGEKAGEKFTFRKESLRKLLRILQRSPCGETPRIA